MNCLIHSLKRLEKQNNIISGNDSIEIHKVNWQADRIPQYEVVMRTRSFRMQKG